MAPGLSKHTFKYALVGTVTISTLVWLLKKKGRKHSAKSRNVWSTNEIQYIIKEKKSKGPKVQVDKVFLQELYKLLTIGIPGVLSNEFLFLLLIAGSLTARTICDLWLINMSTLIETSIITMNLDLFKKLLLKFVIILPSVAIVTNIMKYSISEMKLRLRTNLTHYLMNQYLKGFTYYKINNLDARIANPDQLLTIDIDKFCESFTDLYGNIMKPLLDIIIYASKLTINLSGQTPLLLISYLLVAGTCITTLRRPVAQMTMKEQQLEGEYRHINTRLITNSEEIAFYQGNNREKLTLLTSFHKLITHLRKFLEFKFLLGILDNFIGRYLAMVVGFYAVSIPFFKKDHPVLSGSSEHRFKHYYTYGRMLVKFAEAIGVFILASREITRLVGFTARVTEIKNVLNELNSGKYARTMITNLSDDSKVHPGAGKIVAKDNIIRFEHVPLVTPNGDILIKELTFEVQSGMNVIVCGPNGCGKSSLFRILGELWPVWGGTVIKPPRGKLFYIPQRPYMTLGTLRDQVIYPHTKAEMVRRGQMSDEDLQNFLNLVQLSHLLKRNFQEDSGNQGWDAVGDWMDILSGGEKQRIAMARLFYHKPQFAILDECTSAVSVDVEDSMYSYCKDANITLFTVSHRRSLWKHHEFYLQMDGRGGYEFGEIGSDTEKFGS
ncbi:ATP-binding cassette sub-family D member 3-like [Vespa mandarinia]|uniref:ATP-binding cassette sub-family D member 3-like n=1 Tax=Vespa mandarinia TaxID=7446 RepID=UPI00160A289B|nr:ATP-binding cassette sub-family D member 3-like [Vespa mandarinia]